MKFTRLLKNIIVENRVQILINKLTEPTVSKDGKKQKPKLTKEELFSLVEADPTTRMNEVNPNDASEQDLSKIKAGSYVNWLISQYLKVGSDLDPNDRRYKEDLKSQKELFFEDLYKVTQDLTKFHKFKNRLEEKDINKYNLRSLYDAVKDFDIEMATTTKAERQSSDVHPGGKIVFEGDTWRVVEIKDKGEKGREAACFYGGNQVETRWCTSAPGLSWFDNYIKKGPLYVIYNPNDPNKSKNTGLPIERYQFSFGGDQFMDKDDTSINLPEMLNGKMSELKEFFKPYFIQGVIFNGENIEIENFDRGALGKYLSIYKESGFQDVIEMIPDTVTSISISNKDSKNDINIDIQPLVKLKNLKMLYLENCISEVPDDLCELTELTFLGFPHNPKLRTLPECLAYLPKLKFINCKDSENLEFPPIFSERAMVLGKTMVDFSVKRKKTNV